MRIYERYRQCQQFAVITSGECLFWKQLILTSTLESIAMLDRTGSVVAKLQGSHLATCMALHSNNLAVGYQDGSVRVWDLVSHSFILFNGHKSAITSLAFDSTGTKLASADIDIVLWDIVAETGILRFKGHKDNITCLLFLNTMGLYHLLSGSKDSILKVWDIAMQQCVENVVSHRGEIWAMDYLVDEQITLFTGAADGQVRVWSVNPQILFNKFSKSDNLEEPIVKNAIELIGNLDRESKERILSINVYSNSHIGIQGADRVIDIFKKKTAAEIKKTISRRKKRAKTDTQNASNNVDLGLNDKISIIESIRCSSKVKSFAFLQSGPTIKLVASLANNSIEVHEIAFVEEKPQKSRLVSTYDLLGHRSDIRTLCLSSDDELLASGSSDLLKIWSTSTSSCLNTIPCGYALCSTFVPGNKYVIIGTKAGTVEIYDLASSSLVECIQAHEGPIWSLQQRPDQKGIVSGSQDKEVKFWDYRMVLDENYSKIAKRMTLYHTRTLKLHDDVLCVRVSPDGKLLAVALLDLTVKVFYMDTLKFFLSLYGHKLPVISMDIAYDSKIIITASSDKSVKIWGLDFGDCHKSLLAHSDSVMSCNFVWGTYFFFTASKDKTIKYWDAEKV
jgi:U3 small nucleolar RNA-associated protein 12